MTKVLVLLGGDSPEREISLRSGTAVAEALTQAGYAVEMLDAREPAATIIEHAQNADVVFPVLHGLGGEDGEIQKILEHAGLPFVGSGSVASERCFDKWSYKQLLLEYGLPTPNCALVSKETFRQNSLASKPFVLKPHDGGSSIDTYIVRHVDNATLAECETALERHNTMLLEELIEGAEITVGVLHDRALPVVEIIPPSGKEFDLENKYNGATQELCPPLHVALDTQERAQQLALQAHTLTGCQDMSRTDIIIDRSGALFILETNTIPGMTNQSLFPKAAMEAGYPMDRLVSELVTSALARNTATS